VQETGTQLILKSKVNFWRKRQSWLPDWVNFRLLGEFLLWAVFWKLSEVRTYLKHFGQLFPLKRVLYKFLQK
jgi:hypothetical protein